MRKRSAFTLVELLVVIVIIGILAGLTTAAAIGARKRAKIAATVMEIKQLEMACQAYKEKFGEYPPDFAHVAHGTSEVSAAARAIVCRHLARAFPRYTHASSWSDFVADVSNTTTGWGVDPESLTPNEALAFWLGGMPTVDSGVVTAFNGFSADPSNPFNRSASRIKPIFDFNVSNVSLNTTTGGIRYWPSSIVGDKTTGAIAYFRAESDGYVVSYLSGSSRYVAIKTSVDSADADKPTVYPAVDSTLSKPNTLSYVWVNARSIQIFSAGMGGLYATPKEDSDFYPDGSSDVIPSQPIGPYEFPGGDNYNPNTYDDITNFAAGELEDKIP